jgi:hypothetical protein
MIEAPRRGPGRPPVRFCLRAGHDKDLPSGRDTRGHCVPCKRERSRSPEYRAVAAARRVDYNRERKAENPSRNRIYVQGYRAGRRSAWRVDWIKRPSGAWTLA